MRMELSLSPESHNLLEHVSNHSKLSRSLIIEKLILEKLSDPIKSLKDEKRALAIRMNEIDVRIEELYEAKKETITVIHKREDEL